MPEFKQSLLWPCTPERFNSKSLSQKISLILGCNTFFIFSFCAVSKEFLMPMSTNCKRPSVTCSCSIIDIHNRLEVARSKRVILCAFLVMCCFWLNTIEEQFYRVLALWLVLKRWRRDRGSRKIQYHQYAHNFLNQFIPESSKFHVDPKLWTLFWEGALKLLASQRCMESFEPEKRKSATRCAWHRSSL